MIDLRKQPFIPSLPLIAPEEMTASQFRRAYGVPVASLPHVRESLAMEREALREVYGDHWRDDWREVESEFHADGDADGDALTVDGDGDALTVDGDGESFAMIRGFSARLTFGDFDGEGED